MKNFNNKNRENFNLTYGKILFIIILFVYLICLFYWIIDEWSLILFIRIIFLLFIMIIFWYKLSQQYYPTIYIQRLENTYEKLNNLNEDLIWYNKAKQEADNKFLPEKHSKWIKRFNDKWINIIFLIFFFIIIINQTFPNLIIDLSIFWKSGILILIQYSLYRVYLDWNYIYPNIKYFQETSPLFYPDNDGLPKINWRKHIFEGGTKLRGVGQACLYCCIMCAGICWVGKEFFPKNQSICEQTGNYIQNNEFFKKKIERILPPNKENE